MKKQIFISQRKNSFGHGVVAVFMALTLILQNAVYVQSAFANNGENESMTTVTSTESSSIESDAHTDSETHHDVSADTREEEEREEGDGEHVGEATDNRSGSHTSVKDSSNDDDSDEHHGGDIDTITHIFQGVNTSRPFVNIVASKIVCDTESKLPNYGLGGPQITANTAIDYVAAHPGCVLTPGWKFQWGYASVNNLGGTFVGEADGSKGPGTNTGIGISDWKTFGSTNESGVASTKIYDLGGTARIWVREVLKDGYIPFTCEPFDETGR